MTNEEFCKNDTSYYGELVDNIEQIVKRTFTGEELKEYVEHHIEQVKNNVALDSVGKRFSLDDIKDILFKHEMKYHEFKHETTKEFSQQQIERFTKNHIDDFLRESNVC